MHRQLLTYRYWIATAESPAQMNKVDVAEHREKGGFDGPSCVIADTLS